MTEWFHATANSNTEVLQTVKIAAEAISYTKGFKKTGSFFHKLVELEIYT